MTENTSPVLTETRLGGGETATTYGPAGPLTLTEKVSATESRTTTIGYDAQGRTQSVTDARGKATTLAYAPTGDLASITDPLGHVTRFGYDEMGRRTQVTDALGASLGDPAHTTTTTYDSRGRVTRVTSPDGAHSDFVYDLGGRRTSVTDPAGRTTRYTYDAYSRLESVVDPLNGTTRYTYDLMGNLLSLTDAEGHSTSFEYDGYHRVDKVTYPGGAFESYSYDGAGRLATRTDRKGTVTTYSYDDLGRLTGKSYSDGATPPVSYTYDAAGRLATAANGTDTLGWTYDLAGQLLTETSSRNASTVAYSYDLGGNRLSLGLDGQVFVTYGYDDASRLVSITRNGQVFAFGYDAANRRTSLSYPNGVVTSYGYDVASRVLDIHAQKAGQTVARSEYTYDAAGNRLTKAHPEYTESYSYDELYRLTGVERAGATPPAHWGYGYDAVGNRLWEQRDQSVTAYSYDERNRLLSTAVGGRMLWKGTLSEAGSVTFTSAQVNGQPARMLAGNVFEAEIPVVSGTNAVTLEARDVSGNTTVKQYQVEVAGEAASYSYDPNGNLTQKVADGHTWGYEWNAENQLVRVTKDAVEVARFVYDPLGRRVEKVVGATATAYSYAAEDILREAAGGVSVRYVHGPGIDEALAVENAGGQLQYEHADGLGSELKRTDGSGATTLSRSYEAFGEPGAGAATSGYAYTGREWDPEIGRYYYRARYYDPNLGRFASEDPVRFRGGINFYAYVHDNPVRFRDPRGLWAAGIGGGVNGAVAAAQAGVAGEADCKVVRDGEGNWGILCCWGAGPAVGLAEEIGPAATVIVCPTCKTICDLEDIYVTVQAGGGAGGGASGSAGGSMGSEMAAVVFSGGPSEAAGGYVAVITGGCKLITPRPKSCSSCGK